MSAERITEEEALEFLEAKGKTKSGLTYVVWRKDDRMVWAATFPADAQEIADRVGGQVVEQRWIAEYAIVSPAEAS